MWSLGLQWGQPACGTFLRVDNVPCLMRLCLPLPPNGYCASLFSVLEFWPFGSQSPAIPNLEWQNFLLGLLCLCTSPAYGCDGAA